MFKVGDRVKTKDLPSNDRRVGLVGVVSEQGIIAPDAKAIFVDIDGESGRSAFYIRNLELEETPQELADKLRAAKVEMFRTAEKLREMGYKVMSGGGPAVTGSYWTRPMDIYKEVTTKESL